MALANDKGARLGSERLCRRAVLSHKRVRFAMLSCPRNHDAVRRIAVRRAVEIGMPGTMTRERLFELVGEELGTSAWFQVGQDRIDLFAEVTEDRQFIHVDPVRAAESPFGGTIAHGMLTLSMIVHLCEAFVPAVEGVRMVVNYGFDRVRFAAPVRSGRRIRAVVRLLDAKERSGQILVKVKVTIQVEDETKPALVAEWLSMHFS